MIPEENYPFPFPFIHQVSNTAVWLVHASSDVCSLNSVIFVCTKVSETSTVNRKQWLDLHEHDQLEENGLWLNKEIVEESFICLFVFSMRKAREYASTQAVGKCCSVFWDILGHFYALVFEHWLITQIIILVLITILQFSEHILNYSNFKC